MRDHDPAFLLLFRELIILEKNAEIIENNTFQDQLHLSQNILHTIVDKDDKQSLS